MFSWILAFMFRGSMLSGTFILFTSNSNPAWNFSICWAWNTDEVSCYIVKPSSVGLSSSKNHRLIPTEEISRPLPIYKLEYWSILAMISSCKDFAVPTVLYKSYANEFCALFSQNVVEISMLFHRKFENRRYLSRTKLPKFRRWNNSLVERGMRWAWTKCLSPGDSILTHCP